jgi:hypothetical protein
MGGALFNDRHFKAQLAGTNGTNIAAGACADNGYVVGHDVTILELLTGCCVAEDGN